MSFRATYQTTPPHRRDVIFRFLLPPSLRRFLPSPIPPPTILSSPSHRSLLARRFCIYHIFPSLTMFSRSYHHPPPPPRPRHSVLLAISSPFLPLPPSRPTKPAHHAGPPSRPALAGDDNLLFPVTTTRSSRRSPPAPPQPLLPHRCSEASVTASIVSCHSLTMSFRAAYQATAPHRRDVIFLFLLPPSLRHFLPSPVPPPTIPSSPFPSLATRPPLLHLSCLPFTYHVLPLLPPPTGPPLHPNNTSLSQSHRPSYLSDRAGPPSRPALPADHHTLFPATTTGFPATTARLTAAVLHLLLHLSCLAISYDVLSRRLPSNASSPPRCLFPSPHCLSPRIASFLHLSLINTSPFMVGKTLT